MAAKRERVGWHRAVEGRGSCGLRKVKGFETEDELEAGLSSISCSLTFLARLPSSSPQYFEALPPALPPS